MSLDLQSRVKINQSCNQLTLIVNWMLRHLIKSVNVNLMVGGGGGGGVRRLPKSPLIIMWEP